MDEEKAPKWLTRPFVGVAAAVALAVAGLVAVRHLPHQLTQWNATLYRYNVYYAWHGKDLYPGMGMIVTQPPEGYTGIWIDRYHNGALGMIRVYKDGKETGSMSQIYVSEDEFVY